MLKEIFEVSVPPLATAAGIPVDRSRTSRLRLFDHLNSFWQQFDQRLLVVRAGPGYGKTTLLAEWVAQAQVPTAWHTLTPADRDASTFVTHLIDAVEQRFPSCGKAAREWLRLLCSGPEALRAATAALAACLGQPFEPRLLILDDFHVINGIPEVEDLLNVFLRCCPRTIHLILSERSARSFSNLDLVASGGLFVLNEAELCLPDEEIAKVWRQSAELPVDEEEFSLVVGQCAGWVQGALLWAQSGCVVDPFSEPASPAGDVFRSYFQQQALAFCTPEEQDFMKSTCLLEEMSGPLCDALLEQEGSAAVLASLERRGVFLTHLGAGLYRFHPLFRKFLLGGVERSNGLFARLKDRADDLCRQQTFVLNLVRQSHLTAQGSLPIQEILWVLTGQVMREQTAHHEPQPRREEKNGRTEPEVAASLSDQNLSPHGVGTESSFQTKEPTREKTGEQTEQVKPSPPLRARGFGPGDVWRVESRAPLEDKESRIPLSEWKYRYPRELFFYVLDRRQTTNEKIGCALWPEAGKKRLRHLLGQATSRVRQVVGGPFAIREQGRYELDAAFSCSYDVAEFEDLLNEAERMKDDSPEVIDLLEQAVELSQGEFLESLDSEWVLERREDLARQRRQALLRLVRLLLARQDLKAGKYYEDLLREDPYLEEAIVGRLRCYLLADERGLALRFYQECTQRFRKEFGAELPASVQSLYREIRKNGRPR